MWQGILAGAISAVVFSLIDAKVGYVKKVYSKAKTHTLRVLLFIMASFLLGGLGVIARRVIFSVSDNELLSIIVEWAVFGAVLPFVIGGITSKKGESAK
jgi:hypothetical protein